MIRSSTTAHALTYLMLKNEGAISPERSRILMLQTENAHRAKYDTSFEGNQLLQFPDAYKEACKLYAGDALFEELGELSPAMEATLDAVIDQYGGMSSKELEALPRELAALTPEAAEREADQARINAMLSQE